MQKFSDFSENDHLNVGIPKMYDDIVTALSNSSGNAFPTANLQVGMTCYRTDLQKEYRLIKVEDGVPTWQICDDANISVGSTVFDSKGNQIDSYYLPKESTLLVTDNEGSVIMRGDETTAKDLCSRNDGLDNLGKSGKAWGSVYAKSMYAETSGSVGGAFTVSGVLTAKSSISVTDGITSSGNITSTGTITATKVFNAVYNDYAEWFPRKPYGDTVCKGHIVASDDESDGEYYVLATNKSKAVVGICSTGYAQIIGGEPCEEGQDYEEANKKKYIPIALAGRVPVWVDGAVKKGDYIVPSSEPGIGRASKWKWWKSVGKALENNADTGRKLVMVLVR